MSAPPLVEICVQDAAGVAAARDAGADRVELCVDIGCGGLTPPQRLVEESLALAPAGGLQVLVRPRPGDFVHTPSEIDEVEASIRDLAELAPSAPVPLGFVVGVLDDSGRIAQGAAARWRAACEGLPLTFHRAFDALPDLEEGVAALIRLGYDRVLTTGGDPAVAKPERLRRLVGLAGPDLVILASGGLRSANVAGVVAASGASEVHMRAPGIAGGTDPGEVRRILAALGRRSARGSARGGRGRAS